MADYIYTDDGLLHETNELKHYGILGMKWGVRRYQTKNGTLTKAGKRRYEKEVAKAKDEARILRNKQITANKFKKLEEMKAKNKAKKNELEGKGESKKESKSNTSEPRKKQLREMSNDEIRAKIERIELENRLKSLTPQKVSAGQKFMEASVGVLKNSAQQILVDTGKAAVNKWLGLDDSDFAKLEKKAKIAELKKKIAESEIKERTNRKEKKQEQEEAEAAKSKTKKDTDDNATKNDSSDSHDYTVSGSGTSRRREKKGPIYDADWTDVSDYSANGRATVTALLDDPRKKKRR